MAAQAVTSAGVAAFLCLLGLARSALAGQTRCWIDKGALVAPAAFGDIAGDFLIDLSAPQSVLHLSRAQAAGLEGPQARGALVIAGVRQSGVDLAIADLDARTAQFDTVINGVLGADVLRPFVVEITFEPCRIRLERRAGGPAGGGLRLPVSMLGGRPLIPAAVSDGAKVRQGQFAIDTGRWATSVAEARLSRPAPPAGEAPVRLRALEVGGRLFEQVPARPEGAAAQGQGGAIGLSVWSAWRMRLDMTAGWLDLWPAEDR